MSDSGSNLHGDPRLPLSGQLFIHLLGATVTCIFTLTSADSADSADSAVNSCHHDNSRMSYRDDLLFSYIIDDIKISIPIDFETDRSSI